ncbi:MAG TPA: hypothetical protein VL020_02835 [Pseudomonadales bacterium]|nr:hypothetical protein [Pseudomonadales bacterium]
MSKKEATETTVKQSLTIKVTTLVLVGVTLFAGIAAGWNMSSAYHINVQADATSLAQSLEGK